ncbi:MAG: APC family permease [Planctomycetes bacterium]|nr:APC family permease [Planctomycetota bacterium]
MSDTPSPGAGPDPTRPVTPPPDPPDPWSRAKRFLVGPPRDLRDRSIYQHLSLIAFLAWVGLGADGLSSSAYGPEEAFRTLGGHAYLALALAVVMAATVLVIAYAYSRVIEHFPHGGGGYLVATKLLGERAGVVSGSALLVDYVLTITVSIAAAGDALFSFLPLPWHAWKLTVEAVLIVFLSVLNLRGVKESVLTLTPVFVLFLLTHAVLIGAGILVKAPALGATLGASHEGFRAGLSTLGWGGLCVLFLHAYSLGGGTYTGIEAVSNGLAIMREPRVETGKRTMLYMAASLAFTASGLLLCYLLWNVAAVDGKTMNAVLVERFVEVVPLGSAFVIATLVSEGALLVVAAQAGFVDGPRVLANMALDSWVPRRFAALSERLTTENGILLMGLTSLSALLYTKGDVRRIVVMYSINVFLTFSMTMLAMCRMWVLERARRPDWVRGIAVHIVGLAMCVTILAITVHEKFGEGGWITLVATGAVIGLCFLIRRHYDSVTVELQGLFASLLSVSRPAGLQPPGELDPAQAVAVVLVGGYSGLGIHTFLNALRAFPGHFKGVVFVSVGVIDSREFKGEGTVEALRANVEAQLAKYVGLARGLGLPAAARSGIGTDAVDEAERLCIETSREFAKSTFFAGRILFGRERWYQHLLHNESAFAVQRRLQWAGKMIVVIPARLGAPAA